MTEPDAPPPDDDRGAADVLWVAAVIVVEFGLGGAFGNLVYDAPRQLVRRLRSGQEERRPGKPLTREEAIGWATWLIEAQYLDAVTSAGRTPTYNVLSWSHADRTWTVELDYLDAGIFGVTLSETPRGALPEASVSWRRQTQRALAAHDPSRAVSSSTGEARSVRARGLRAWILFALRGRLEPSRS